MVGTVHRDLRTRSTPLNLGHRVEVDSTSLNRGAKPCQFSEAPRCMGGNIQKDEGGRPQISQCPGLVPEICILSLHTVRSASLESFGMVDMNRKYGEWVSE